MLDCQISRALLQPSPWELAQWRAAPDRQSRREWSDQIDIGGSHRLDDAVLGCVEAELARGRMSCGPSVPVIASAGPVPTELARTDYYLARVLYSWLRPDRYALTLTTTSAFPDKVATAAEGAVVTNVRAVDTAHAFMQASAPRQADQPATSGAWNNREIAIFVAAELISYTSNVASSAWNLLHNGAGADITIACSITSLAAISALAASSASGIENGLQFYVTSGTGILNAGVYKQATTVVPTTGAGAIALNTPTYVSVAHSSAGSPQWTKRIKGTVGASGAYSTTPGSGNALEPLTIGALQAAATNFPASMQLADVQVAPVDSAALRARQQRYMLIRYGLAA